jgi:hypothetical protein
MRLIYPQFIGALVQPQRLLIDDSTGLPLYKSVETNTGGSEFYLWPFSARMKQTNEFNPRRVQCAQRARQNSAKAFLSYLMSSYSASYSDCSHRSRLLILGFLVPANANEG